MSVNHVKTIIKIFDYNTKALKYSHEETDVTKLSLHKVSEAGELIVGDKYRIEVTQVLADGRTSETGVLPLYIPVRPDSIPEVIVKPIILMPAQGSTLEKNIKLIASQFKSEPANTLVHQKAEWFFSYSASMAPLITMSGTSISSGEKTEYTIPIDFSTDKTVYVKVKYTAVGGTLTSESTVTSFKSKAAPVPEVVTKPSVIAPTSPVTQGAVIYSSTFTSTPANTLVPERAFFKFSVDAAMSNLIANTASESVGPTYEQYAKYVTSATLFNYLVTNNINTFYVAVRYKATNGTLSEWSIPVTVSRAQVQPPNQPVITTITSRLNKTIRVVCDPYSHPENVAFKDARYRIQGDHNATTAWSTTPITTGHTFSSLKNGSYRLDAQFRDINNRESIWSTETPVTITDMATPNKPISTLVKNDTSKTINIKGSAYSHPDAISFKDAKYKLNGIETDWSSINPTSTGHTFTSVSVGTHTLNVKYRDTNNRESDWSDNNTAIISSTAIPTKPIATTTASGTNKTVTVTGSVYSHPDNVAFGGVKFRLHEGTTIKEETGWLTSNPTAGNIFSNLTIGKTYKGSVKYRTTSSIESVWSDSTEVVLVSILAPNTPIITVEKTSHNSIRLKGSTYSHADGVAIKDIRFSLNNTNSSWMAPSFITSGFSYTNLTIGTYGCKVQYRDTNDKESTWSAAVSITLAAPVAPNKPTVTVEKLSDTSIKLTGSSYVHADSIPIKDIRFSLNNVNSNWMASSFITSGFTYTGLALGSHSCKVQYRDTNDKESTWSDAVLVTLANTVIPNVPIITTEDMGNALKVDVISYTHPKNIAHHESIFKIERTGDVPEMDNPFVRTIIVTEDTSNNLVLQLNQYSVKYVTLSNSGVSVQYRIEKIN